ncbi:hypothetical protein FM076_26730 [Streptomyces albus subsp. chlorinus]|uniref:hypothetical protein n=1 Tax=Streptomyces albus TaxID=1888 RepID=UPI00156EB847|nr:hypothetical protein [Streptomyces albus]NSC24553.1 hypothetical protein [Streptomyces albus subsp. chlorinus]
MHRTPLIRACAAGAAALAAGAALAAPAQATTPSAPDPAAPHHGWVSTGTGMTSGVSGMVTTGRHGDGYDALIVRDSKKPGENRLASVTHRPGSGLAVKPLAWKGGGEPVDLEALDRVPGHPGSYVALASAGAGYRIDVDGGAAHVRDTFTLPGIGEGDNFEGFALTSRHGRLAAVWADRGQDDRPATLYSARVSLRAGRTAFGTVTKRQLRAPYPAEDVRHTSDLKITDSGSLLVGSASDPGDDGPFDSAVFRAGSLEFSRSGAVSLRVSKHPEVLGTFAGHKIEALACLPDSRQGVLGTDDENAGGALRTARFCER